MAHIQKAFCSARDAFSKHPPLLERINVMVWAAVCRLSAFQCSQHVGADFCCCRPSYCYCSFHPRMCVVLEVRVLQPKFIVMWFPSQWSRSIDVFVYLLVVDLLLLEGLKFQLSFLVDIFDGICSGNEASLSFRRIFVTKVSPSSNCHTRTECSLPANDHVLRHYQQSGTVFIGLLDGEEVVVKELAAATFLSSMLCGIREIMLGVAVELVPRFRLLEAVLISAPMICCLRWGFWIRSNRSWRACKQGVR